MVEVAACDFCGSEPAVTQFGGGYFGIMSQDGVTSGFNGPWKSCNDCADLIRANNKNRLIGRILKIQLVNIDAPEDYIPEMFHDITEIVRGFFLTMTVEIPFDNVPIND